MKFLIKGYGCCKTSVSLFIFLGTVGFILATSANSADTTYLDALLKRSEDSQLHRERYWQVLLHYKHTADGFKSLVDDPRFFLSTDGKKEPRKELEATLTGFFQDDKTDDSHPRCRFVARYEWLRHELDIDESLLPVVSCKEFDDAYSKIKPKSAVLIFPAAYINGPASTFGHTLIRIDSDYQSKLLSYAVTYAAFADDTNGILYAFKGIFGYYKGYFTILPYYEKIKEYNDLEHRDIWEYRLNLSEDEVSKMLLHLWELKEIYSDYYFFDENCSYSLLFLLEAARPSLHLTDAFGSWVIPIDTLKVMQNHGLIDKVEYRPSKGTRIRHIASLLDDKGQDLSLKIAADKIRPENINGLDRYERIKILDLAAELVQFKYNKRELAKEDYQREFLSVLKVRSQSGRSEDGDYKISESLRPEQGHGSSRFSLGMGFRNADFFQEVRYRAAQHELADPDGGYIEGSEIVFFGTTVRNIPAEDEARIESVDIIDIVSISPRDKIFKPTSWKVKTGFGQKTIAGGKEAFMYLLNTGGGFAYKNKIIGLFYLMGEADLNVGGGYKGDYSLGVGPSIGAIREVTDFWKMNLFANAFYYELGDNHEAYKVTAQQVFRLNRNNSLNLDFSWKREFELEQREIKLNWNVYF